METSKSTGKVLSPVQMREFYHGLDFFLVCSTTEGTPNPALEAASCGVPLITTKVGNMPDLVKEGYSGFFVNDTHKSVISKVGKLLDVDKDIHYRMKRNIRFEIIDKWDWHNRIDLWKKFFGRKAL